MSITRPIAEHARRLPDEPSLFADGRWITRRELDEEVARLAAFLADRVPHGGSIALDLPNGPALALLFLAAATAGRNAQVLDCAWPLGTARKVIAGLKPSLVVTTRPDLRSGAIVLNGEATAGAVGDMLGARAGSRRLFDPDPDAVFYTGFTSGSTGLPKGFVRTHRSWLESFAAAQEEFGLTPADCVYAPGPLSHSMPLYALASALHAGARVVLARAFQAHAAVRAIVHQRVTVLYAVPAQLMVMIEAAEAAKSFCHEVRLVLTSGAKWPPALTRRLRKVFPNAVLAEFYGASELSFVTLARSDERVPKNSVGRPFPGVKVSIRDSSGKSLGTSRAGFVFAESPLVFAGYTSGKGGLLRAGKALSVGDRGRLDRNGFLFLEGRADRLIIASGRNVQAEEVEAVLDSHPEIAASAVLGVRDRKRGARLAAIVSLRPNARVSAASLVKHLRKVLPAYKVPTRFAVAPAWPRTRTGKTDFAKLEKMWAAGRCEAIE